MLRQDNTIISSLLNLLKERTDCFIKYIFAGTIFDQKSVSHQNYYVIIKSKKYLWENSRNIASREISTNIEASAKKNNNSSKKEKICT